MHTSVRTTAAVNINGQPVTSLDCGPPTCKMIISTHLLVLASGESRLRWETFPRVVLYMESQPRVSSFSVLAVVHRPPVEYRLIIAN